MAEVAQRPLREQEAAELARRHRAFIMRERSRQAIAIRNAQRERGWCAAARGTHTPLLHIHATLSLVPRALFPQGLLHLPARPARPSRRQADDARAMERDAIIYMQKAGDFEEVLNDDEPYTDESPLDSTDPTEDKSINKYLTERPRKGKKAEAAKAWDGTTRRYCPHGPEESSR